MHIHLVNKEIRPPDIHPVFMQIHRHPDARDAPSDAKETEDVSHHAQQNQYRCLGLGSRNDPFGAIVKIAKRSNNVADSSHFWVY